jgi:hypothetical protein
MLPDCQLPIFQLSLNDQLKIGNWQLAIGMNGVSRGLYHRGTIRLSPRKYPGMAFSGGVFPSTDVRGTTAAFSGSCPAGTLGRAAR